MEKIKAMNIQRGVVASITLILIMFWSCMAFAEATVDVTDNEKVAALLKVQQGIDAMSEAVMRCMETGREQQVCMCRNKDLFAQFTAGVNDLFSTYPEFANHDLVGFKEPGGMYVNLSLERIQKQAQAPLNCTE